MAGKKVEFGGRPTPAATNTNDWVEGKTGEPTARLTLDIPRSLHAKIKSSCALRHTKMVVEITELLEAKYGGTKDAP